MVKVTFNYEPEDPDDSDRSGLSEAEFNDVTERLLELFGAEDINIEKIGD